MCLTYTDASSKGRTKEKGRKNVKWIIIAFYWGGSYEAVLRDWAAQSLDWGEPSQHQLN